MGARPTLRIAVSERLSLLWTARVCRYATTPALPHSALDTGVAQGEQLTINVFEDFLRKVWHDKIVFRKLNLSNPGEVPIGPNAVIVDDLGFTRSA